MLKLQDGLRVIVNQDGSLLLQKRNEGQILATITLSRADLEQISIELDSEMHRFEVEREKQEETARKAAAPPKEKGLTIVPDDGVIPPDQSGEEITAEGDSPFCDEPHPVEKELMCELDFRHDSPHRAMDGSGGTVTWERDPVPVATRAQVTPRSERPPERGAEKKKKAKR